MKKNVLVIGGSYFAGRVFSIHASKDDRLALHVVNRGRYTLNLPWVSEYKCDRHDVKTLSDMLPDIYFDAVVDFCGYSPGEIELIINALSGRVGQYVFISTASIYSKTGVKKEDDPVMEIEPETPDPISEYLYGKIHLERELKDTCAIMGIPYTIARPNFIYGPYNYAPRESYFIRQIVKGIPVPDPTDATAKFSMVYVLDVARALAIFTGNEKAYNEAFNLAGEEQVTYTMLFSELERINGKPFVKKPVTISQVMTEKIPLPFPLDADDLTSGEKMTQYFGFKYTSFADGMAKTFSAFKPVFSS